MYRIVIRRDGLIQFIYSDELRPLVEMGNVQIQRVSHVEPKGSFWFADMSIVAGPMLGPYTLRSEALAAEEEYLHSNFSV